MEDRNMKKVTMLSEDELDKIAGGLEGKPGYIDCPYCSTSNPINRNSCSAPNKMRCRHCGRDFTICF